MSEQAAAQKTLHVEVERRDSSKAEMISPQWAVPFATTSKKPVGAPTPTLMLLGALATCMVAGIEREAHAQGLQIDDVKVVAEGVRMPPPQPVMENITVHITLVSPEKKERLLPILDALETNGTVTNTLKLGSDIAITHEIVTTAKG